MSELVRELREKVAAEGLGALTGRMVLPESWVLFSEVGHCEELGYYLPSVCHPGVRYPLESIEVTGRTVRYEFYGGARVRVKVTFAAAEGIEGGSTGGWMLV
jgi:hypothetical protein